MSSTETKHLTCMEVWGGNQAVDTALTLPGLDAWLFSQPDGGSQDGGDVHYASSCAAGALSRMLVADVSGHGSSVAETARRLRKLMQRHIIQHEQTRFVEAMNREFAELAKAGRFATAIAFTYDSPLNRLQVCIAGHPDPLIYRSSAGRWSYLEQPKSIREGNFPLGIEGTSGYEEFEPPVQVGDMVLCYTDALSEFPTTVGGRMDSAGLLEFMSSIAPTDPARVIPQVLEKLKSAGKIEDDLTLLLFRMNGSRTRIPFAARLLAPFKFVGGRVRELVSA